MQPHFVNQYILTDVYLSSVTSPRLRTPILPSIATLVNPLSSLIIIIVRIIRTLFLVALSHLPGSQHAIKKISVANTSLLYHDGRALATCESGPPMRIALPGLETVGWFNGRKAEGESGTGKEKGFGDQGLLGFMREWTTAHVSFTTIFLNVTLICQSQEWTQQLRNLSYSTRASPLHMCTTLSFPQRRILPKLLAYIVNSSSTNPFLELLLQK